MRRPYPGAARAHPASRPSATSGAEARGAVATAATLRGATATGPAPAGAVARGLAGRLGLPGLAGGGTAAGAAVRPAATTATVAVAAAPALACGALLLRRPTGRRDVATGHERALARSELDQDRVAGAGDLGRHGLDAGQPGEGPDVAHLVVGHQRDDRAGRSGPRRTAGSVQVRLV